MLFEKIELEPSEAVLAVVRKHWFVILGELLGAFLMTVIPLISLIAFAFMPDALPATLHLESYLPLMAYGIIVWLLFSLITGFMIWTHYYLDLWVITDRRIIAIDQIHFFNRKVSSFRLERLQDIKVEIKGVIPTFLNFGTLHAHTAGTGEENFISKGLPNPRELQALIQKATDNRLLTISGQITHIVQ
jgi:Bacterial PH domain